jgi:hypothetical protein
LFCFYEATLFYKKKNKKKKKIALSKQLVRFLNWNIASGSCTCLEEHFLMCDSLSLDKLKEDIQIYLMAQGHRVEDFSQVNAMLRFKGNCKSTTSNQVEKQSEMIVA